MVYRMTFHWEGREKVKYVCLGCVGQYQTGQLLSVAPTMLHRCEDCGLASWYSIPPRRTVQLWDEGRVER